MISDFKSAVCPKTHVWVNASAGTGKTYLLICRILRILLSGSAPSDIICLTFTHAAAEEMTDRIMAGAHKWHTLSDHDLKLALSALFPDSIEVTQYLKRARTLHDFLREEGFPRIQTLHGFCETFLRQFPLEAGIAPGFGIMSDPQKLDVLKHCFSNLYHALPDQNFKLFDTLLPFFSLSRIEALLNRLLPFTIEPIFTHRNLPTLPPHLLHFLKTSLEIPDSFLSPSDHIKLNTIRKAITTESISDLYTLVFTKEGSVRKKLMTQGFMKQVDLTVFNELIQTLITHSELAAENTLCDINQCFSNLLETYKKLYSEYKMQFGLLDFDDLIEKTHVLFQKLGMDHWICSKIQNQFCHILVDEAQDTSPSQWAVITSMIDTFITPFDQTSLFIVGDRKQSIYSFQGANCAVFDAMHTHISAQLKSPLLTLEHHHSFRSTAEVLACIDTLFAQFPNGVVKEGEILRHTAHRSDPGTVFYHPFSSDILSVQSEQVAVHVQNLIQSGHAPSDILILLRNRHPFMGPLYQALKKKHIPVQSFDRLILQNHKVCLDFLSLLKFFALPHDDYNLACLLKSPLIGLSENELQDLCINRSGYLFEALSFYPTVLEFLAEIQEIAESGSRPNAHPSGIASAILYCFNVKKEALYREFPIGLDHIFKAFFEYTLNWQTHNPHSIQLFISDFEQDQTPILGEWKDGSVHALRIMTVHGSKGLEAPIVMIIDTGDVPTLQKEDVLLVGPHQKIIKPTSNSDIPYTIILKERTLQELQNEHFRLLYVALTRSRDRIDFFGPNDPKPNSWSYAMHHTGMQHYTGSSENTSSAIIGAEFTEKHGIENAPILFPKPYKKPIILKVQPIPIQTEAQIQGIKIHHILESFNPTYLDTFKTQWAEIIKTPYPSTLFDNPIFHEFFIAPSYSEVELSLNQTMRRVDRLVIKPELNEVWIVEYKTGEKNNFYHDQVSNYYTGIHAIFKDKIVRIFLIWISIMEIEEVFL